MLRLLFLLFLVAIGTVMLTDHWMYQVMYGHSVTFATLDRCSYNARTGDFACLGHWTFSGHEVRGPIDSVKGDSWRPLDPDASGTFFYAVDIPDDRRQMLVTATHDHAHSISLARSIAGTFALLALPAIPLVGFLIVRRRRREVMAVSAMPPDNGIRGSLWV